LSIFRDSCALGVPSRHQRDTAYRRVVGAAYHLYSDPAAKGSETVPVNARKAPIEQPPSPETLMLTVFDDMRLELTQSRSKWMRFFLC
jgi:hypothetical protein